MRSSSFLKFHKFLNPFLTWTNSIFVKLSFFYTLPLPGKIYICSQANICKQLLPWNVFAYRPQIWPLGKPQPLVAISICSLILTFSFQNVLPCLQETSQQCVWIFSEMQSLWWEDAQNMQIFPLKTALTFYHWLKSSNKRCWSVLYSDF